MRVLPSYTVFPKVGRDVRSRERERKREGERGDRQKREEEKIKTRHKQDMNMMCHVVSCRVFVVSSLIMEENGAQTNLWYQDSTLLII